MKFIAGIEQIASQLKVTGAAVDNIQIISKIIVSLPSDFKYFLTPYDNTLQEIKTPSSFTKRLVKEETSPDRNKNSKMDNDAQGAFMSQQSGSA